jgi:hypothetical protein
MIWTPLTAIMFLLGAFGLALMLFAAPKAYRINRLASKANMEERYALEKEFYLLSTVVWVILISRIVASVLFWVTNESLIPLIPGAMCQFGIYQAGTPYSWIANGVKLVAFLVYGIWLSLDFINRRSKGATLMPSLARLFILLIPLLLLDMIVDLAFYYVLNPVVVPCCRIVFTAVSQLPCPYCFVFHDAPAFIVVIASYGLSVALVVWGFAIRHYTKDNADVESVGMYVIRKYVTFAIAFAVIGTIALIPAILQVLGGGTFFH